MTFVKATLAISVGVLVVAVVGVISLERLLDSGGGSTHWADAIIAVATIILVAVTAAYVVLTKKLTELQAQTLNQVAKSGSDAVARRVLDALPGMYHDLGALRDKFPIDDSIPPSPQEWFDIVPLERLNSGIDLLRIAILQLPKQFERSALKMHLACMDASSIASSMVLWLTAPEAMKADGGSLTWDDVRAAFYSDDRLRQTLAATNEAMPEWSDITAGKRVKDAYDLVSKVEDDLSDYVRG